MRNKDVIRKLKIAVAFIHGKLWIILPGIILFILWLPTYWYPSGRDQGVFSVVALDILDGKIPYRDVLDLKPPGIFYIYAITFKILGYSMNSIRIMDLILVWVQLISALLLFPQKRRLFAGVISSAAMGIACFHLLIYWWMTAPDYYITIPFLWGIIIYQKFSKQSANYLLAFICGIFLGIAFWIKFTALFLSIVLIYIFYKKKSSNLKENLILTLKETTLMFLGYTCFSCLLLAYFYFNNALKDLLETLFILVPRYAGSMYTPNPDDLVLGHVNLTNIFNGTLNFAKMMPNLIIPSAVCAIFYIRKRKQPYGIFMLIFGAAFFSVLVQNRMFVSHLTVIIMPLSILSAGGFEYIVETVKRGIDKRKWRFIRPFIVFLSFLIIISISYFSSAFGHRWGLLRAWRKHLSGEKQKQVDFYSYFGNPGTGDFSFIADLMVARYIQQKSSVNDEIFIWGFEPLIYALSGRQHSTRFPMNYFIIAKVAREKWKNEFYRELHENPPEYFIVVRNDYMYYITGQKTDSRDLLLNKYKKLNKFINNNYKHVKQIEHFEIYEFGK